jgi:hypothetical protein
MTSPERPQGERVDYWWILGGIFLALSILFAFGAWRGWWEP